jgi:hypothetical protein
VSHVSTPAQILLFVVQEIIEYVMRAYSRTGRLPRGEKQVRDGGAAAEKYRSAQRAEDDFFARSRRGGARHPGRAPIFPEGNRRGDNKINGKSEKNDYFY